jgi:hypothetical protein
MHERILRPLKTNRGPETTTQPSKQLSHAVNGTETS